MTWMIVDGARVRAYRNADHPDLVEISRPELRELAEQYDVDATDEQLDQLGISCRQAYVAYRAAFQLVTSFAAPKPDRVIVDELVEARWTS